MQHFLAAEGQGRPLACWYRLLLFPSVTPVLLDSFVEAVHFKEVGRN